MKSNLVVMVGPPGCGKTTFIKNQFLKGNHISRDKIRFSLLEDGEAPRKILKLNFSNSGSLL